MILVLNSGSSSVKYRLSIRHRSGGGIVERIGEPGGVADHHAALGGRRRRHRPGDGAAAGRRPPGRPRRRPVPRAHRRRRRRGGGDPRCWSAWPRCTIPATWRASRRRGACCRTCRMWPCSTPRSTPTCRRRRRRTRSTAMSRGATGSGGTASTARRTGTPRSQAARLLGRGAGEVNMIVAASGQRGERRRGARRAQRGHVDGLHAAGGSGDGHPSRRPRPWRAHPPVAPARRRHRGGGRLLQHESGLRGLCGDADMRAVLARRAAGDDRAALAFDVYCHRIRKYVGAYHAVLGRLDAIAFTGGGGRARRRPYGPSAFAACDGGASRSTHGATSRRRPAARDLPLGGAGRGLCDPGRRGAGHRRGDRPTPRRAGPALARPGPAGDLRQVLAGAADVLAVLGALVDHVLAQRWPPGGRARAPGR